MSDCSLSIRRFSLVAAAAVALLGLEMISSIQHFTRAAETEPGVLTSRPRAAGKKEQPLPIGREVRTESGQRRRVVLGSGSVLYVNEKTTVKRDDERRLTLATGEIFVDVAGGREDEAFVVKTPRRELAIRAGRCAVRAGERGTGIVVASGQVRVNGAKTPLHGGQQLAADADEATTAARASHRTAWTRDLMADSEAPLVPKSQYAGGRLLVRDPDGQQARLDLRKYHIDVHIEDGFARTTIDQTYFNHTNTRLEGTFYFPLPPDASLSRLAMYVDGRLMEGGMAERDYARRVYEQIIYQQRDPALLEWLDSSTFKMRVFPLEPRQEKRLVLSYTQKLPSLYGQATYRFPTGHSLDDVREWSLHIRVKDGVKGSWHSPSHALKATTEAGDLLLDAREKNVRLERDVVLTIGAGAEADAESVRFRATEQEGAKYLMLRYRPALPGRMERPRRDWLFLFESSGDRDPLLARTQIEIVRGLLANAEPDDTFAVLTANTRVRAWKPQAQPITPENVRSALDFLEKSHLIGALDLGHAFSEAQTYLQAMNHPYLVHVGSGIAAMGERRNDVLAKRLPRGAAYIGIGVGKRWNRALMKQAAENTAGYFTRINPDETLSWRTFELSATLNTPRLLDVSVTDKDGQATFLPFARSLAQGEELAAIARIDKDVPQSVVIRGRLNGEAFEKELPVRDATGKADYLPRSWARLEIERLLAEDAVKHKKRIIALSKAMYVMTPFTSLLVLENEEMYQQFKVDRGRKDHWAMYPCPEKIEVVYEPEDGQPGDPKKGIKPSAQQVGKTILARGVPSVLTEAARTRVDAAVRGFVVVGAQTYIPASAVEDAALPSAVPNRSAIPSDFAGAPNKLPVLSKMPYLQEYQRMKERKENLFLNGLDDTDDEATSAQSNLPTIRLEPPGLERLAQAIQVPEVRRRQSVLRGFGATTLSDSIALDAAGSAGTFVGSRNNALENDFRTPILAPARGDEIALRNLASNTISGLLNQSERLEMVQFEKGPTPDIQDQVADLLSDKSTISLLYQRPTYSGDDRPFFDLVAYAPGLNTSDADVRAVIEAEAAPRKSSKLGVIEDAARRLFAKSRFDGWRVYVRSAKGPEPVHVLYDGQGRYAWERTLPIGLRERVVCDGTTLWYLYPELGLAARREVSRFHRVDFARLVPWVLPRPEDLARGADLRVVAERTVAVVPHGIAEAKDDEGKPRPYTQIRFVFAADNRLTERQLVEMPAGNVLFRETYSAGGAVKVLDVEGKVIEERAGELWSAKEGADLKPDTRKLVVLSLPHRSREHVLKTRKIDKKDYAQLRFEDGLALLAADFAAGNSEVVNVFQRCFANRDQHQLGLYVLLAACGQNLDSEHLDVLARHPHEPLAQYLALHSSPVLRKHASQWAVGSNPWGEGYLQRLALAHALLQRWQSGRALGGTAAQRRAELERATAYVSGNKGSAFAWALLGLIQDRAREDEANKKDTRAVHRALAESWSLFADVPGLAYAARYEQARSLYKSGQAAEARKQFRELYERTLKEDRLPLFDGDLRAALLEDSEWGQLLRKTATKLIERKRRPVVLTLATQCWQVDDQPLANHLLALALADVAGDKDSLPVRLAGLSFLWQTGQFAQADKMLRELLAEAKESRQAALWRLAAKLAERRAMPARQMECLEQALTLEYEHLPEIINLRQVRSDYETLLRHYQTQAEALASLKLAEPAGFQAKVVRTADRWRALDRESGEACRTAADILQTLGDRELTWDYLTTPVAERPNEAEPWLRLAQTLNQRGELTLADRAFQAAFESEPTNAQLLWFRAGNLRQAGQAERARELYRRLADGDWQPRFRSLQTQARWEREKR
ncbi:MAG TPA: VIT domain-containing protein [Gemmataceae bacterium]|jgi:Tfp pilus assembly protein PilF